MQYTVKKGRGGRGTQSQVPKGPGCQQKEFRGLFSCVNEEPKNPALLNSPLLSPKILALLGRSIVSLVYLWKQVQLFLFTVICPYPQFLKICHVIWVGGQRGRGWGALPVSLSVRELRSSSFIPHLCRDTQVLVRHPAGHKMPSFEKGQTAIARTIQLHEDPDLADCIVSNSFLTNRTSSLLPGHLPCVGDSGKWSGISMSSLY